MKRIAFPVPAAVRRGWVLCLLAGLLTPASAQTPDAAAPAPAAAATGRTLQGLDVASLEGGRVQIILTLSDTAPEPVIFTVDKPARLSLDLPDTKLALTERFKRINAG